MTKQELIEMVEALPEGADLEHIAEELERATFMAKVQRGIAQLDRGEGIPHEVIEKKIDKWLES